MGLRGPGAYRYWTNPCSSDFRELVFGPVDESPNHIRLLRNRWHDGGENAVHQHYWEAGRRAWAWWRFSCPLRERRMALKFRTVVMARRSSSQAPRATTLVVDGAEHEFAVSEIGAGCFRLGGGHGPERTMQAPSKLGLPVGGAIALDAAAKVLIGPTPVLQ